MAMSALVAKGLMAAGGDGVVAAWTTKLPAWLSGEVTFATTAAASPPAARVWRGPGESSYTSSLPRPPSASCCKQVFSCWSVQSWLVRYRRAINRRI